MRGMFDGRELTCWVLRLGFRVRGSGVAFVFQGFNQGSALVQ